MANLAICKLSSAADSVDGMLYVVYTRFDTLDCSANMIANGELYAQHSSDGGITWSSPQNLTNTQTPGCFPGDCYSEVYPSVANKIDENLHIFYQLDKGYSYDLYPDDPMLYYKMPITRQDIGGFNHLPSGFELFPNYPNPFNAQTSISFRLGEKSRINLSIYNLLGQRVITLVNCLQDAGEHKIIWNAKDISSGVYYARLEAGQGSRSIKMMLLK